MVKTHTLTLFVATMMLSFIAAPSAFAGPNGNASNSVTVAADGPNDFRIIITDLTREQDPEFITYSPFGNDSDTTWACADWEGNYMYTGPAVLRDNGSGLLWIMDPDPTQPDDLIYQLFGAPGDIPTPGDWAPEVAGVELGVARVEGEDLVWYVQDHPEDPARPGCACSRYVYGSATDTPAAGNWDGDPSTPWQLGYTTAVGDAKQWTTATLPPADGGGESVVTTFGNATDMTFPGDVNATGQTTRQVVRTFPDDPGEPTWFQYIADDGSGPQGGPSYFNFGNRENQVALNCVGL